MNTSAEQASDNKARKTPIHFPEGLYGFESVKDYVLLQEDDAGTIWCLQAANGPIPSFIVLDPFLAAADYRPEIPRGDYEALGSPAEGDLCFLVIAVIAEKPEDTVVNLKSPLVINAKTRTGKQIILEDSGYPVRRRLFTGRETDRN